MYLAHSNIKPAPPPKPKKAKPVKANVMDEFYYKGYQNACEKYADRIAKIQEYYPGWMPTRNDLK